MTILLTHGRLNVKQLQTRARPDERRAELRWVAPVLVGSRTGEGLVATVHAVEARDGRGPGEAQRS